MKIRTIIFLLVGTFFSSSLLQAQGTIKIDSLKKVLDLEAKDTATLHRYFEYAIRRLQTNNSEAKLVIFDWLIATSIEKKYRELEAKGYYFKGTTYHRSGHADQAVELYTKAMDLSYTIGLVSIENAARMGIGSFYNDNQQYDKALIYFEKAVEAFEQADDKASLGAAYYNMAHAVYGSSKNSSNPRYSETFEYYKLAYNVAEMRHDTALLVKTNVGMATMCNLKKEYELSEEYMKKAGAYIAFPRWEYLGYNFYGNFGKIYQVQDKHKEAIVCFEKSLEMLKKYPNLDFEYKINKSIAESYEEIGDYTNAYKYQLKYSTLKDSLLTKEKFTVSAELENKYQQAIKDKEINRLNTEQRIKQLELEKQRAIILGNVLEAKRKEDEIKLLSQEKVLQDLQLTQQQQELIQNELQAKADSQQIQLVQQESLLKEKEIGTQKSIRNYLIGGLALLCLLAFILYRNIIFRKKAYKQLQVKSQQIKDQALQLSKQAKLIAQFQSQMNPHFVYNALHNIQGLVLTDEKQKANTQIQSLAQLMRKTFANADKDDISLEEEINYLHKYIEFEKTSFDHDLDFEVQVKEDAEGVLLPPMMIQPFVENAIKHAELTKVENPYIKVLIEIENNLLAIVIMDNGTGIKKEAMETDRLAHSLSVIKSRLDLLFEGRADANNQPVFSVKTVPEIKEGTWIKFYLPLNYSY